MMRVKRNNRQFSVDEFKCSIIVTLFVTMILSVSGADERLVVHVFKYKPLLLSRNLGEIHDTFLPIFHNGSFRENFSVSLVFKLMPQL